MLGRGGGDRERRARAHRALLFTCRRRHVARLAWHAADGAQKEGTRRRPSRRTARFTALRVVLLATLFGSPSATSALFTSLVKSGNNTVGAALVGSGNAPTVTANNNAVTVSWTASQLSNGTTVTTYLVKRYDN